MVESGEDDSPLATSGRFSSGVGTWLPISVRFQLNWS